MAERIDEEVNALLESDVSATALLTLYCHASDAQTKNPILDDRKSREIVNALHPLLSASDSRIARYLTRERMTSRLVTHIALRARQYDTYAEWFLRQNPEGVIVDIGCGLDSRFERIDNGTMQYFDLELPVVTAVRRQFFQESDRHHLVSASVFEEEWLLAILQRHRPVLFLAEGVFMYCDPKDVRALILRLSHYFPGSELVCEVVNSTWLRGPLKRLVAFKQTHQLHLGESTTYRFGLAHTREMEEWDPRIEFVDDWSYLDSYENRGKWLTWFRSVRWLRYTQWTVHYRFR